MEGEGEQRAPNIFEFESRECTTAEPCLRYRGGGNSSMRLQHHLGGGIDDDDDDDDDAHLMKTSDRAARRFSGY